MKYYRFFERNGDHVYTKCTMGGIVNQFIATNYEYWTKKNISEIRDLSQKTLMVGVEKSKEKKFKVD